MWKALSKIKLWDGNPNEGDIGAIMRSIKTHGFNDVVHVWNDTAMSGNHRTMAVRYLIADGWLPVGRCIRINDNMVEVWCVDISDKTWDEAVSFALAINRTNRLGHDDQKQLLLLLQNIASQDEKLFLSTGYDGNELDDMLAEQASRSPVDPPDNEQQQPQLEFDHVIEIHCNAPQLDEIFDVLNDWKSRHGITVNIS